MVGLNIHDRYRISMRRIFGALCVALVIAIGLAIGIYWYAGAYGFNGVMRRGGSVWMASNPDDARVSPSMKLALTRPDLKVTCGDLHWREIHPGFHVGELPVLADGREVDRIMLARIDPARFRFEVKNRPAGDKDLQGWMQLLGAALVINGSYFASDGTPVTPLLSAGAHSGPKAYDATHGAFVASGSSVQVQDLSGTPWSRAFEGADHAMVSYPMLIGSDGKGRAVVSKSLANRSFVAQDTEGYIILGTTADAFFSLDRLTDFLRQSPLKLKTALNLDGGSVACQGISLDGFVRHQCGKYESRNVEGRPAVPLFGQRRWTMPIVLAVFPK
jgi:hypothetical protein